MQQKMLSLYICQSQIMSSPSRRGDRHETKSSVVFPLKEIAMYRVLQIVSYDPHSMIIHEIEEINAENYESITRSK